MANETITTIKLSNETLKRIKLLAIEKGTTQRKVINDLLNQALDKTENKNKGKTKETENKIPEHLIANKDTYNPDPDRIMSRAGIIKTKEPFDTAKAIDEVRKREY